MLLPLSFFDRVRMLNTKMVSVNTKVRVNYQKKGQYWWGRVVDMDNSDKDGVVYTIKYEDGSIEPGVVFADIIGNVVICISLDRSVTNLLLSHTHIMQGHRCCLHKIFLSAHTSVVMVVPT